MKKVHSTSSTKSRGSWIDTTTYVSYFYDAEAGNVEVVTREVHDNSYRPEENYDRETARVRRTIAEVPAEVREKIETLLDGGLES